MIHDEAARLAALHDYAILDTPAEQEFDDLARLASSICGVPIALINLIDSDRLWSKAQVGLPLAEMQRVDAFCHETIQHPDLLVVPDLLADARFAANPTVRADPHFRFYAGAPLITPQGQALGTICILDRAPRNLTAEQQEALRALARQVMTQLELRRTATALQRALTARSAAVADLRVRTHAVEAATSGIVITDAALRDNPIIYMNPAFEELTGYAETDVLGHNCRFLQGPETDPGAVDEIRAAIRAGRSATVSLLNYRKDGTRFWQELSVSPLRDAGGRVTHFVGVQNDITERQQAAEALRRSEEHFHALIDSALDIVVLLDQEGHITYESPSVERVTGRRLGERTGRSFFEYIHAEDQTAVRAVFRDILAAPATVAVTEFRLATSAGSWAHIEAIAKNLLALPSVAGIVVNARDITPRKAATQALQQQYAFTTAITNSLGEGVYALDVQGRLTFMNPAAARLLGWTVEELLGAPMHDMIHYQRADGARVAAADCPLLSVLQSGTPLHTEEDVFTRKDGSLFPVAYTSAPIITEGRVQGAVLTFTAITERLQFQNQLKNQNVLLEQRVRARTRELEEAGLEILHRLGVAAEFRDDETGQHVARVGHMARRIARVLGLPEEEVAMIGLAAPLHDVGKIGVADRILLKPGALTEEEFAAMKTHTRIGGGVLAGSHFAVLQLAEQIALAHHERWDGSGYPHGLCADAIPLAGRIVAVADVFDALTHERPYKQAWPVPDAIAMIRRASGQHFDPQVVDAFLRVMEDVVAGEATLHTVLTSGSS